MDVVVRRSSGRNIINLWSGNMNLKQKANERWKRMVRRTKTGLELTDIWPIGKWKDKGTVEYVIENDYRYVEWCVENNIILLSNVAYGMYLEYAPGDVREL